MKSINNPLFEKKEIYNSAAIRGAGDCHTVKHEGTSHSGEHVTCDHSKDKCEATITAE
jgi:hypothetical protein